jgi:hypothetical protein
MPLRSRLGMRSPKLSNLNCALCRDEPFFQLFGLQDDILAALAVLVALYDVGETGWILAFSPILVLNFALPFADSISWKAIRLFDSFAVQSRTRNDTSEVCTCPDQKGRAIRVPRNSA